MATTVVSTIPAEWTLADLYERLGGIPLDSVNNCNHIQKR